MFAQLRKAYPRLDLNSRGTMACSARSRNSMPHCKNISWIFESEAVPPRFLASLQGESFDLWNPDTIGTYYAWADPEPHPIRRSAWIQAKRLRAGKRRGNSPHREFPLGHLQDRSTLPCFRERLAFRDVSRATDSRTVRVPRWYRPNVFIGNQATLPSLAARRREGPGVPARCPFFDPTRLVRSSLRRDAA